MTEQEIRKKLKELRVLARRENLDISEEIVRLETKLSGGGDQAPDAWKRVELARHAERPTTMDYISRICSQFMELHGDRCFSDDPAIIGGIGLIGGRAVTILGHQKGRNMKENIRRNYGMAHPDGYRKALRLAKEAEKFGRPVVTFIDTSGAFPGLAAEERGIGEAIARNLMEFSVLKVPVVCVVIGEGGSGGALGIGVGDEIYMLENSIYSVISPEGFASILLRDATKAKYAAGLMKLTATDLFSFGIIDGIIPEGPGGAHQDPDYTAVKIKQQVQIALERLTMITPDQLVRMRSKKFRSMGDFYDGEAKKQGLFRRLLNGSGRSPS